MSCNRCARQSTATLAGAGVPPDQVEAAFGSSGSGHCPRCGRWVSGDGVCSHCAFGEGRAAWCKHCDWEGTTDEAGWDDEEEEYTCPDCGGAEWLRVRLQPEGIPRLSGPAPAWPGVRKRQPGAGGGESAYEVRPASNPTAQRPLTQPLDVEEMQRMAEQNDGYVKGVVAIDFGDVVDGGPEGLLDTLSHRLTGSGLLTDVTYSIVGHDDDTLLIEVEGDTSLFLDDLLWDAKRDRFEQAVALPDGHDVHELAAQVAARVLRDNWADGITNDGELPANLAGDVDRVCELLRGWKAQVAQVSSGEMDRYRFEQAVALPDAYDVHELAAQVAAEVLRDNWAAGIEGGVPLAEVVDDVERVIAGLEAWKAQVSRRIGASFDDLPGTGNSR